MLTTCFKKLEIVEQSCADIKALYVKILSTVTYKSPLTNAKQGISELFLSSQNTGQFKSVESQ